MNIDKLVAIDTHVHVETELANNEANAAALKYFGNSGAGRSKKELAEYYRSRNMMRS